MKPGFEPKVFKSYNLTLEECKQQELFIKENLKKGYIHPSKSLMASPFFFVNKKDGKLLYYFDQVFTISEKKWAKMADKFSFDLR